MRLPPGTQHPRRRRQLDWELISCGVGGHALVGRDAARAREVDAAVMRERDGTRWHRCLRCDCWVALPRPPQTPRDHPPDRSEIEIPLRGKALRDRIVLRVIAVDRLAHFLILGLLGVAVLLFAANRITLKNTFYRVLAALQGGVAGGPVQASGHVGIARDLDRLFSLQSGTLHELGIAVLAYAALEGVESVGLWLGKRWAEYLTFVATSILLPLEIYEIVHRGTVLKVIGLLVNLAVVIYLLVRKRLFGLRGGGVAEEAQRARDMGWPAIEAATPGIPTVPHEPAAVQA
ncbi:MAG: DUF2127 domain-containing protein [Solirubrobacteraceae bacterium]